MKKMILWMIVLFAPLMWTTTAHAIFGVPDLAALAQRVTIITNQGIQIAHSVTQLGKWQEHLTQLTDQYEQIRDQALGSINSIHDSFHSMTAVPGQLTGAATSWRHDFSTARAQDLLTAFDLYAVGNSGGSPLTDHWRGRLAAAPRVTEQQILAEYTDLPAPLAARAAANYQRSLEDAEQRTASSFTVADEGARTRATLLSALDSYDYLRTATDTGATSLAQAQVASAITHGEVTAALAQLETAKIAADANAALQQEARLRELDAARLAARHAARATHAQRQAGILAQRDGGAGLRLRVPGGAPTQDQTDPQQTPDPVTPQP